MSEWQIAYDSTIRPGLKRAMKIESDPTWDPVVNGSDWDGLWNWLEDQGYIPTLRGSCAAATATLNSLFPGPPMTKVVLSHPDPYRADRPVEGDTVRRRRLALVLVAWEAVLTDGCGRRWDWAQTEDER